MTPSARVIRRREAWPLWAGPRPPVAHNTWLDLSPVTGASTVHLAPAYTEGEIRGDRLLWEDGGKPIFTVFVDRTESVSSPGAVV